MERELTLEFVRVTEAAALASAPWMGKGDKEGADQAAVDAMRAVFDTIQIDGEVVIGEGEKDEAPMLYIGEKIGARKGGACIDIAVDPLEGTRLVARGLPNALAVIAAAEKGCLLRAPDTYMQKIAVGARAKGCIDIKASTRENLEKIAEAMNMRVRDLTVIVLDRPRHDQLIAEIREVGSRIRLISDGDVAGGIAAAMDDTGVDVLMGIGGAPEGVLTAAALKCLGGEIQGILKPRNDEEIKRARGMGFTDIDKVLTLEDLVTGDDVMFSVTGVTDGDMLEGVRFSGDRATTETIIMRSKTGTIRTIKAHHLVGKKPDYFKKDVLKYF